MSSKYFCNEDSSCTSASSSDLKDIFSSSSYDRSSIGSIPWAEDAVKQNQQEWEHIERMFYGEDELPKDPDLRNEILEWRQVFPHLRLNGTKLKMLPEFKNSLNFTPERFEEVFSAHPAVNQIDSSQEQSKYRNFVAELERSLRISSVPVLPRNRKRIIFRTHTEDINKEQKEPSLMSSTQNEKIMQLSQQPTSSRLLFSYRNSDDGISKANSSASASSLRIPPISNVTIPQRYFTHPPKKHSTTIIGATAKLKSEKSVILPAIDLLKIGSSANNFRSISAAVTHHRTPSDHLPYSASKLKNFK